MFKERFKVAGRAMFVSLLATTIVYASEATAGSIEVEKIQFTLTRASLADSRVEVIDLGPAVPVLNFTEARPVRYVKGQAKNIRKFDADNEIWVPYRSDRPVTLRLGHNIGDSGDNHSLLECLDLLETSTVSTLANRGALLFRGDVTAVDYYENNTDKLEINMLSPTSQFGHAINFCHLIEYR